MTIMPGASTLKVHLNKIDNRLTYILGYRNLYNIAVLFTCSWFYVALDSGAFSVGIAPTVFMGNYLLTVLGLKWFLTQVRENIDASSVRDALIPE
jgi:hypothetical protein